MARLEDLTRGAAVKGILPDSLVTVVDVKGILPDSLDTVVDLQGSLRRPRERGPLLSSCKVG